MLRNNCAQSGSGPEDVVYKETRCVLGKGAACVLQKPKNVDIPGTFCYTMVRNWG